jgi:hypothetical protein
MRFLGVASRLKQVGIFGSLCHYILILVNRHQMYLVASLPVKDIVSYYQKAERWSNFLGN